MLIGCSHCNARVDAENLGAAAYYDHPAWPDSYQLALLKCPACRHPIVGRQWLEIPGWMEHDSDEDVWGDASRVWPDPIPGLELSIPVNIRTSLHEASKCLHATAYTACVAMSGRAIEAMCKHFSTKSKNFFEGLQELLDLKIIDERLYEWGNELRKHRNVFVLTEKFEMFKKRQLKSEAAAQGKQA